MNDTRHMKIPVALAVWAGVCLVGAFVGNWRGYGGPAFAVALAAFAVLFAVQVLLASEPVSAGLASVAELFGGFLPLAPYLVYLVYALGAGQFTWLRAGCGLLYAL